ncbi:S8 family serine peptidase [Duganella sp. BuS-21]|uniref:S8 family serine peptidase n=1 Tax=Duganella sp. BuS-21 TaxID=2943848 RepID=UPI0035A67775
MSNLDLIGKSHYYFDTQPGTIRITADEVKNLFTYGTGTVRLELWATSFPWSESSVKDGYRMATVALLPGNGALTSGQELLNIDRTVNFSAPPSGTYYVSIVVTEYTGKDLSVDNGYEVRDSDAFLKWMTVSSTGNVGTRDIVQPTVSIESQSVLEGDNGSKFMVFTLKLSEATPMYTATRFDTNDQTALEGIDYEGVHKSVVFSPGQTSLTVSVPIYGNEDFQPSRVFDVTLGPLVNGSTTGSDRSAIGYITDDDEDGYPLPTDGFADLEWYLYTTRTEFAWEKATGKGVKVGVLDNGIDATHPDLVANLRTDLGRTALTLTAGGAPVTTTDNHGTLVAGVIAAARDGKGAVGVAYDAQLVSIYSASKINAQLPTEIANAFQYAKNLDVLNNSWGYGNLLTAGTEWAFYDNANSPAFAPAFKALRDLAAEGRHGLGTVVVQSAGNGYDYGDDTNLHNFQNSRYIITVGSTDYASSSSYFSTTGASILVSAPGGAGDHNYASIITTDRSGQAGESGNDFAFADGTSFAAPVVSGIVAMMLEVNPHLGYRDVQQILAYTAHQTDYSSGYVVANGAGDWNGGGLQYIYGTQTTGFGQVDALAAVRLAASWGTAARTVANTVEVTASQKVAQAIPDDSTTGVTSVIEITSDMVVERVDVGINISHSYIGDLQIALTSPSGTTSYLMVRPSQGALSAYGSSQDDVHFTFDTVLNWGETATGKWSLNVMDLETLITGTFTDWTLDLIGHAASKDDTYVYTNDFAALLKNDPARAILTDSDGGNNTINTAALGADNYIDLSGVTASILNDGKLTIAAGTTIRNAFGGDGNDTIIANAIGGTLHGMGGNDILRGGAGLDTAAFLHASAGYTIAKTTTGYSVKAKSGDEGADQLSGIERLEFSDGVIALDTTGGIAGQAYRLYQAAFDRTPDRAGLGYWIGVMDGGVSLIEVAQGFVQSGEFKTLYGAAPSNTELVNHLYQNVLHRAPDAAGAAYWLELLDQHRITAADALRSFSESTENVAALVGVTENGIYYTPYHA